MTAFLYRMPSGIAGDVTRQSISTIEAQVLDSSNAFGAFGLFGKIASSKFIPSAPAIWQPPSMACWSVRTPRRARTPRTPLAPAFRKPRVSLMCCVAATLP